MYSHHYPCTVVTGPVVSVKEHLKRVFIDNQAPCIGVFGCSTLKWSQLYAYQLPMASQDGHWQYFPSHLGIFVDQISLGPGTVLDLYEHCSENQPNWPICK